MVVIIELKVKIVVVGTNLLEGQNWQLEVCVLSAPYYDNFYWLRLILFTF